MHLEQLAHRVRGDEPAQPASSAARWAGSARGQELLAGASSMPSRRRNSPWRSGAVGDGTAVGRRARRWRRKSTWAERSASPGAGQRVDACVAADGPEGVADHHGCVARHSRSAAPGRPASASRAAIASAMRLAGRPELEQGAVGRRRDIADGLRERRRARCERRSGRRRPRRRRPAARASGRDRRTNWRTGRASRNSLATSSSGRSVGRPAELVVPVHRQPGQGRRLPLAQDRAGLDQVDRIGRLQKLGRHPRRAQRVGHQRAAPGTELDQRPRGRAGRGRANAGPGPGRSARRTAG